jgi:PIN domain nuclease of toxin-antitoxin system
MPAVVADTHAIVWYLTNSPRLSPATAKALDDASAAGDSILIPSISLVELTYLVEKGRVPAEARKRLVDALAQPGGPYEWAPLDGRVAAAVELID